MIIVLLVFVCSYYFQIWEQDEETGDQICQTGVWGISSNPITYLFACEITIVIRFDFTFMIIRNNGKDCLSVI